ncbi:MAG TPA: hypothetical protein VFP17_07605 [Solirubrobacterales bacterium]|nr:hypothetical protein [Solirubrobacterales bacterium]
MAGGNESLYEVEEMLVQPGTYFNPQTEVVVVVDDSASPDQEVFDDLDGYEGTQWVRVSDEVPVDEDARDRALESFEARSQGGEALAPDALEASEDDFEEEEERPQGVPLEDEE